MTYRSTLLYRTALCAALLTSSALLRSAQAETSCADVAANCNTKTVAAKSAATQATGAPAATKIEAEVTEAQAASAEAAGDAPVSISVDGETVFGAPNPDDEKATAQNKTDRKLEKVDIQVKFDGLGVKPVLNVSTWPIRRSYVAKEKIRFLASSNYPAWIAQSEVRIFKQDGDIAGKPLYSVEVDANGVAEWAMPAEGPSDYVYVLRVSDDKGRFDETKPLSLQRTSEPMAQHEPKDAAVAPGYGEDRTAFRNINVYGGAVTVFGRNVPEHHRVMAFGESIPVDDHDEFVVQRILPPGEHEVDVKVVEESGKGKGEGLEFSREINIPANEWYYVGMADLTVGKRFGNHHIESVKKGEYNNVYTKGRMAFYLKGKIKGRYILTAAADTGGEHSVKHMFRNFDKKDPYDLLRRIDPEEYYPVYGDDSTYVEDAPTRGKFYVRLDRGASHVMWGNFKTNITGTKLLRDERVLYGADAVYKSEKVTKDGERQTEVKTYAAQPGTVPHRDYLLGTGGSAYFLKHQDVRVGTEIVKIEVRDDVGHVVSQKSLRLGHDYDIDYIQGLILLKTPLSSRVSDSTVISNGSLGGYRQYLAVNYDYIPSARDIHGYVYGGRAQQWIGNNVRVGITGGSDNVGKADQRLYGGDILLRKSDETFLEAEVARTRGRGYGHSVSDDGGLIIDDIATVGRKGKNATAYNIEGRVGLGEVTDGKIEGHVKGFFEHKDEGFSSMDEQVIHDKRRFGVESEVKVNKNVKGRVAYEDLKSGDGRRFRELTTDTRILLNKHVELTPEVKHSYRRDADDRHHDTGKRTDAGAMLRYRWDENTSVFISGQGTIDRSGTRKLNNRIGVGGQVPVTEKIDAEGEVSAGSHGIGALGALNYHPTADDKYYFGYRLEPNYEYSSDVGNNVDGDDYGTFVVGARRRFNERVSAFIEDNYDPFGSHRSLTQTYGVDYTPSAEWRFKSAVEIGRVYDDGIIDTSSEYDYEDFRRRAASLSGVYTTDDIEARLKGEIRFERGRGSKRDRDSYLASGGFGYKVNKDWRFQTDVDAVLSHRNHEVYDGRYVQASAGFAYRPLKNDRFNALFRYTFLYDVPTRDQVGWDYETHGPRQLNNILSADFAYDLNKWLTLGAKYGFRIGREERHHEDSSWHRFAAQLGIIRADYHIVKKWDIMLEGRVLNDIKHNTTHLGALTAVYREVSDNFRVGVGYNFGHFSDDLRDLRKNHQGVFFNAIGKF